MILAYLRLQAHELRSLESAVRADEYDAVHQMRVATRRLRATLRSFGTVIPRAETAHLAAELKWLGQLLGTARDDEVLPAHLRDSLRPIPAELVIGPVHARVQGHFSPRRAAGHAEATEALGSPRYAALLTELDQLTAGPLAGRKAGAPARDVLPKAVGKAYRQASRRMRRARHTPPGQAGTSPCTRPASPPAAPGTRPRRPPRSSGKPARRFARQMKKVQSCLGEHQDAVLARQSARDLGIGAHLAGENAFTYGLLYEHERTTPPGSSPPPAKPGRKPPAPATAPGCPSPRRFRSTIGLCRGSWPSSRAPGRRGAPAARLCRGSHPRCRPCHPQHRVQPGRCHTAVVRATRCHIVTVRRRPASPRPGVLARPR